MNTLSKVSIEVNMGRKVRLEMCHVEDLSKVLLVDVTSGQELFSDSEDRDRITKDDGANLEVEVASGISEKYLGLESLDKNSNRNVKKKRIKKKKYFFEE